MCYRWMEMYEDRKFDWSSLSFPNLDSRPAVLPHVVFVRKRLNFLAALRADVQHFLPAHAHHFSLISHSLQHLVGAFGGVNVTFVETNQNLTACVDVFWHQ